MNIALKFIDWYSRKGAAFEANAASVERHLNAIARSSVGPVKPPLAKGPAVDAFQRRDIQHGRVQHPGKAQHCLAPISYTVSVFHCSFPLLSQHRPSCRDLRQRQYSARLAWTTILSAKVPCPVEEGQPKVEQGFSLVRTSLVGDSSCSLSTHMVATTAVQPHSPSRSSVPLKLMEAAAAAAASCSLCEIVVWVPLPVVFVGTSMLAMKNNSKK